MRAVLRILEILALAALVFGFVYLTYTQIGNGLL